MAMDEDGRLIDWFCGREALIPCEDTSLDLGGIDALCLGLGFVFI
jgi:hypothetical protein